MKSCIKSLLKYLFQDSTRPDVHDNLYDKITFMFTISLHEIFQAISLAASERHCTVFVQTSKTALTFQAVIQCQNSFNNFKYMQILLFLLSILYLVSKHQ